LPARSRNSTGIGSQLIFTEPNDDGTLSTSGFTRLADGRIDIVSSQLSKAERALIKHVAETLTKEVVAGWRPDEASGSNIFTGAQLALIRAHACGISPESIKVGTAGFKAMKSTAIHHSEAPVNSLSHLLSHALCDVTNAADTWADKARPRRDGANCPTP